MQKLPVLSDLSIFVIVHTTRYVAFERYGYPQIHNLDHNDIVTCINIPDNVKISEKWLEEKRNETLRSDDVIVPECLNKIWLMGKQSPAIKNELFDIWESNTHDMPSGPYIVQDGSLWPLFRLYDDVQKAFVNALGRVDGESFIPFRISSPDATCISVPVSSRLQFFDAASNCLSRYRIVISDAFDIAGVRTTLCNTAIHSLYQPIPSTAAAISPLAADAEILGKTKVSFFLSGERPFESVDYQSAWNPRGDGYLSPGNSCSGAAVAVAAYDWVDVGVGIDADGSVRLSAQNNGVFALRISQGVLPQAGMFTPCKRYDVPGIFARDLRKLADFAVEWYAGALPTRNMPLLPWKLVLLMHHSIPSITVRRGNVGAVVRDLERLLGVEATIMYHQSVWNANPPAGAGGASLHDFLDQLNTLLYPKSLADKTKVEARTFLYEKYCRGQGLRNAYRKKFNKDPFVSKFMQLQWDTGEQYSSDQYIEGNRRLDVYKEWWLNTILEVGTRNTVVVMQSEAVQPRYRDDPPPLPASLWRATVEEASHPRWIAPILGAPEIVLPVGQIPYASRVTRRKEQLPETLSLMSDPNSDLVLLALAQTLFAQTGRVSSVKTGSVMFDL